jgi:hypothetical protein
MRVSDNGRYLIDDDGAPFFYLADTAWTLFYKPTLAEVRDYLVNRKRKGFTVIMPVILWHEETDPHNPNGDLPLANWDPAQPNDRFFDHVDAIIDIAESLDLHMALLPTWGEFVGPLFPGTRAHPNFDPSQRGPVIFTPENASAYADYLARRFGDRSVTWVLGGDRLPLTDRQKAVWRAMADSFRRGPGTRLITYHPSGMSSSSEFFHEEPWLDFNMMQTTTRWDLDNYNLILADYNRAPAKPVVDGETRYEDSYERFSRNQLVGRRVTAHQVRKAAYNAMLSGALGHTYGCRDVWYFHVPTPEPPAKDVKTHWRRAMDFPGAWQMGIMRELFTRYPWHELIPEQEGRLALPWNAPAGAYTPAAIARDGRYALVYFPEATAVGIDTSALSPPASPSGATSSTAARRLVARWFDPRTGAYQWDRRIDSSGVYRFVPPISHGDPDFVLILEREETGM